MISSSARRAPAAFMAHFTVFVLACFVVQIRIRGGGAGELSLQGVDDRQDLPPVVREGGLRPGELLLIGGAQGTGKTTMALQMARNVALGLLNDLRGYVERVAKDGAVAAETIRIEEERKEAEAKQRRRWFGIAA